MKKSTIVSIVFASLAMLLGVGLVIYSFVYAGYPVTQQQIYHGFMMSFTYETSSYPGTSYYTNLLIVGCTLVLASLLLFNMAVLLEKDTLRCSGHRKPVAPGPETSAKKEEKVINKEDAVTVDEVKED